ncbi:unnamed protein product [Amoebophrya sp. A25]|nr:unnamed protein product [Amoebophrya sp. A25]|eukprot:GSA25T00009379001.1
MSAAASRAGAPAFGSALPGSGLGRGTKLKPGSKTHLDLLGRLGGDVGTLSSPIFCTIVIGFFLFVLCLPAKKRTKLLRKIEYAVFWPTAQGLRLLACVVHKVMITASDWDFRISVPIGKKHWKKVAVVDPNFPIQIEFRLEERKLSGSGKSEPVVADGIMQKWAGASAPISSSGTNESCSCTTSSTLAFTSNGPAKPQPVQLQQCTTLLYTEREASFSGSRQGTQSLHVLQKIVKGSSLWDLACDVLYRTVQGGSGMHATNARPFYKFLEKYRALAPQLDYLFDASATLFGRGMTHKAPAHCYKANADADHESKELEYVETPLDFYNLLKPFLKSTLSFSDVERLFRICRLHAIDISSPLGGSASCSTLSTPASAGGGGVSNRVIGLFDLMAYVPHVDHGATCFLSLHGDSLSLYAYNSVDALDGKDENGAQRETESLVWRKVTVNRLTLENSMVSEPRRRFLKREMGSIEVYNSATSSTSDRAAQHEAVESSKELLETLKGSYKESNIARRIDRDTPDTTRPDEGRDVDDEETSAAKLQLALQHSDCELSRSEEERFLHAYNNKMWDSFRDMERAWCDNIFPLVRKRFPHGTEQLGALYEYLAELLLAAAENEDVDEMAPALSLDQADSRRVIEERLPCCNLAKQYVKMAFVERFRYFGASHPFTKRAHRRQQKMFLVLKEKNREFLRSCREQGADTQRDRKTSEAVQEEHTSRQDEENEDARERTQQAGSSSRQNENKEETKTSSSPSSADKGSRPSSKVSSSWNLVSDVDSCQADGSSHSTNTSKNTRTNTVEEKESSESTIFTARPGAAPPTRGLSNAQRKRIRQTKEHLVDQLQGLGELVATLNQEKRKLATLTQQVASSMNGGAGAGTMDSLYNKSKPQMDKNMIMTKLNKRKMAPSAIDTSKVAPGSATTSPESVCSTHASPSPFDEDGGPRTRPIASSLAGFAELD